MQRREGKPPSPPNGTPVLRGEKVVLRPKSVADAFTDYTWRRDPELSRLDAALPLVASYKDYLANYQDEFNYVDPRKLRFAIEVEGAHVGNCVLFNLDLSRGETEMGIMIGDRRYWNQGYGSDAIQTLLNYAFAHFGLRRIYLYTLEWNIRAQKCFQKCGFKARERVRHEGSSFIVMEVHRSEWEERQRRVASAPQEKPGASAS